MLEINYAQLVSGDVTGVRYMGPVQGSESTFFADMASRRAESGSLLEHGARRNALAFQHR